MPHTECQRLKRGWGFCLVRLNVYGKLFFDISRGPATRWILALRLCLLCFLKLLELFLSCIYLEGEPILQVLICLLIHGESCLEGHNAHGPDNIISTSILNPVSEILLAFQIWGGSVLEIDPHVRGGWRGRDNNLAKTAGIR